ncbi:hypothetical protein LMH87_004458 [Akanthomyces muscarius]|uniref:C6 transcription factor n=1 Tax=Akanthomyces muscarius TaxID=2231603 RepID=A0A9W8Q6I4_AKAMU|nr:hypothetical protein LMH87_004458 [Akanthomyces muscarius]KAJ4145612.1 hypothetical protein LMH87_004458 [Akanthomyces muscarius]
MAALLPFFITFASPPQLHCLWFNLYVSRFSSLFPSTQWPVPCRNCTKHKIRCPYNDIQVTPEPERAATPDNKPDLMWTPQIEADIAEWQRTGVFPFPSLGLYPAPIAQLYSVEDLRLIYHLAALYQQLAAMDANNFTLWTRHIPTLLQIGANTPYVMHALLAFSAMHIGFLTSCQRVTNMAFDHRGTALSGLHAAIGSFSRETSDAILAASLVLSWQANDWRSWTQLMQGTSAVIDAMETWKHESLFTDFIAESSTFPTAPPSPDPEHRPSQPRKDDLDAFQRTLDQVQKVEAHLRHHREDTTQVQHLIGFLKGARKMSPTLSIAQQYERLQPLRTWLFWMPVSYLQNYSASPNSLVVIAHLYTVALLMERLFPEIGAAYFGSLSILPVEEIARRLMSISVASAPRSAHTPLTLMEFPIDTVSEFRSRMGWVSPERTRSFPQFNPPNFPTQEVGMAAATESYVYNSPAFSYSAEEMPMLNNAVSMAAEGSPMMMSSPFVSQHYLGVPSPSFAAYSPASSTFEGSVAYSDPEEYASFDLHNFQTGHSPMLGDSHLSYGVGNPSPSLASNATYPATYPPPRQDAASMYAPAFTGDMAMFNPDAFTMLPRPESPMPSSSSPAHFRHRQNTSVSSGPHPPSPLTQAPLVPEHDPKGKGRAR